MVVSGQIHAPAALALGKKPPVPTGQEAGWSWKSIWTRWQGENFPSLLLPGIEPPSSSPYPSQETDWAIPHDAIMWTLFVVW